MNAHDIVRRLVEDEEEDMSTKDFMRDNEIPLVNASHQPHNFNTLPLGSISHGTMRSEDLVPRFIAAWHSVSPEDATNYAEAHADALDGTAEDAEEVLDDMLESLFNVLNEYTLPYTYFGSNDGDGSDYGVWIDNTKLEEDIDFEEIGEGQPTGKNGTVHPSAEFKYLVTRDARGEVCALYGSNGLLIWKI